MGKSYGSIRERIVLCYSCGKPIADYSFYTVPSNRRLKNYIFHSTAQVCADAQPLAKDWYRQNDRTKTHHGAKARLQEGDGYTGHTDDEVSMWLGYLEPEDNL